MNLRTAPGTVLNWVDTRRSAGFSNFLFVDQYYTSHPAMRRIFSLARKQGFQSALIEEVHEKDCDILAEENQAIAQRQADFTGSSVHRISFFRCLPQKTPTPGDFIGSAIFKSDSFSGLARPKQHVYESLMLPPRGADENNFVHCSRQYEFQTAAGSFSAKGVIYAQQNDLTFVCAHVALRTALASLLPNGDITYARINALAGVDHRSAQVGGGRGLEPDQMEAVLNGLGVAYDKIIHEPGTPNLLPTDYQRHLYGCIESGGPALLGFELNDPSTPEPGRHIIPVLGHTFNEDAWVPEAQRCYFEEPSYYPSESWLSSFLAHDDNFGPYYCLPRNFLKKDNFRIILALKQHQTIFSSLEAEALAFAYSQSLSRVLSKTGNDWLDRFSIFTKYGSLVIRTQCVTREDYVSHLTHMADGEGNRLEAAAQTSLTGSLPPFFWMAELSAPELFTATRHKFGELLIAADKPLSMDLTLFLGARLPGHVLLPSPTGVASQQTNLAGHTPLFVRTS